MNRFIQHCVGTQDLGNYDNEIQIHCHTTLVNNSRTTSSPLVNNKVVRKSLYHAPTFFQITLAHTKPSSMPQASRLHQWPSIAP